LWTYNDRVFLPHGSKADGHAALQPVWLTDSDENPNDAQVLFLSDGATSADIVGFELVCELFDGRDDAAVSAARERWRVYKEDGHDLTYWQQTERGGWEQKAGG
jgi:DNA polymerase-3 subunit chi